MSSTRLPGKVLAPIVDRQPLLGVLARRLASAQIDWWLATTDQPSDDVLAAWGRDLDLNVWRGDEDDVLSRFVGIVEASQTDWVVRVTADDPFTDGEIARSVLEVARNAPSGVDVIGEVFPAQQFPLGFVPQVVRASALLRIGAAIPPGQPHHRAHVTSFLIPDHFCAFTDDRLPARTDWRWTVDTGDDLTMTRAAFALFGDDWPDIGYASMVDRLDKHPDLVSTNTHVEQKSVEEG